MKPRPAPALPDHLLTAMRSFFTGVAMYSQTVADRLGMSSGDLHCLNLLAMWGPMTAGQLSRLTGLTSGAVTRMVDRLEAGGFVVRCPAAADRRKVIIDKLPNPVAISELFAPLRRRLAVVVADLPESDRAAVLRFLQSGSPALLEAMEELRTTEPAPPRPQVEAGVHDGGSEP
jgi:DNA-binding MarR family transcriptional regulator